MVDYAYSIRESLQGKLVDFLRRSGFSQVELDALIRDLVGLLATYREEDLPLFPEVYVLSEVSPIKLLTGVGGPVEIGLKRLGVGAAASILKDCAPLAKEGWAIFAVPESVNIRYGLFRARRHSLSTNADERMRDVGTDFPIMLIRNRGFQTVELQSSNRERFTASITTGHAQHSTLYSDVDRFVSAVTGDLENVEAFATYMRQLLVDVLQRCHGTLLAVVPSKGKHTAKTLGEGVQPKPIVNLFALFDQARMANDADSLADLRAAEVLLDGMIGSDGVIVFGSNGSLLAYRSFIKMSKAEEKLVEKSGGNRRRTYEVMKLRTPSVYTAVFFRSQDGETGCHRSNV